VSVANFWLATPQQLYRELEQLERAELVIRCREVRADIVVGLHQQQ
jgi:hypothetical protein